MITKLDDTIWQAILKGNSAERKYIFANPVYGFPYFCFYYFPEYFVYKTPPFHWDFFEDCMKLVRGDIREALWMAFRESAKTTIAKFFVVYCICMKNTWKENYNKFNIKPKNYIAWDSYDGTNAEAALLDVALHLQTNRLILRDFGRLYRKRKHQKSRQDEEEDAPQIKRIGNFITENKIKVEMFTTQESARGRVSGKDRPDLFIFDDIENVITKSSLALTLKIIAHVDEVNSGLQASGCILFLGNYISEEGVIAHIRSRLEGKKGKIVRDIKVVEKGVPTWPGKYTMTNQKALEENLRLPKEEHKISLEQKRADLGETVFQTEMMNDPGKSGDYYFNRDLVRAAIKRLQELDRQPVKVVGGGFKIWEVFNPLHRYGGGGDTSAGNGGDHNASTFYDFSTKPNRIVGTYKSNEISPSAFGALLVQQGQYFGDCFLVPEINNTGYATVAKILELQYWNLYVREVKNKTTSKMQKEWGYYTNESNKYQVASDFKEAWEAGNIEIYDMELLTEMYHFTKQDLKGMARARTIVSTAEGVITRHFDLLKSAFLGWEARSFATPSKEEQKDKYKAPKRAPYEV